MNEEELDILDDVLYIDGVPYNYKVMLLDILTREDADPTTKENEDEIRNIYSNFRSIRKATSDW